MSGGLLLHQPLLCSLSVHPSIPQIFRELRGLPVFYQEDLAPPNLCRPSGKFRYCRHQSTRNGLERRAEVLFLTTAITSSGSLCSLAPDESKEQ